MSTLTGKYLARGGIRTGEWDSLWQIIEPSADGLWNIQQIDPETDDEIGPVILVDIAHEVRQGVYVYAVYGDYEEYKAGADLRQKAVRR